MSTKLVKQEAQTTDVSAKAHYNYLTPEQKSSLDKSAEKLVENLLVAKSDSKKFIDAKEWASTAGYKELEAIRGHSKFLEQKSKDMISREGSDEVAKSISQLSDLAKEYDPSKQKGVLNMFKNMISKVPFLGSKIKENQTISEQLEMIESALKENILEREDDAKSIQEERGKLLRAIAKLEEVIYETDIAAKIIEQALPQLEAVDPLKAKLIKQEILSELKSRHLGLQESLGVNFNALAGFELMEETNKEVVRILKQAETSTMQSIRTSAMLTGAIAAQEKSIALVQEVRSVNSTLMKANAEALKTQAENITQLSQTSSIDPKEMLASLEKTKTALTSFLDAKANRVEVLNGVIAQFDAASESMNKVLKRDGTKINEASETLTEIINSQRANASSDEVVEVTEKPVKPRTPRVKKV